MVPKANSLSDKLIGGVVGESGRRDNGFVVEGVSLTNWLPSLLYPSWHPDPVITVRWKTPYHVLLG